MKTNHDFANPATLDEYVRELGRMVREVKASEGGLSAERLIPGEVAWRDPRDAYDQITVGAVLTARDLVADDARALDGFLSMPCREVLERDDVIECWKQAFLCGETMGDALAIFLHQARHLLDERGRYAEWRRRYDSYMERTRSFLEALDRETLMVMVRRPPSKKQIWLVRYTCEVLRLEFPPLPNRKAAFIWLHDVGANPRYREMR